jgi:hypothetical protein
MGVRDGDDSDEQDKHDRKRGEENSPRALLMSAVSSLAHNWTIEELSGNWKAASQQDIDPGELPLSVDQRQRWRT